LGSNTWRDLAVNHSGTAFVVCAFRTPVCAYYNYSKGSDSIEALPVSHEQNATTLGFDANGEAFITVTRGEIDGGATDVLKFWSDESRGSYEHALNLPLSVLAPAFGEVLAIIFDNDAQSFLTASAKEETSLITLQLWRVGVERFNPGGIHKFFEH